MLAAILIGAYIALGLVAAVAWAAVAINDIPPKF